MKYRTADEFEDFDVMFSESKEASKRCCIPCIVEGANCRSNAISEPPANANAWYQGLVIMCLSINKLIYQNLIFEDMKEAWMWRLIVFMFHFQCEW